MGQRWAACSGSLARLGARPYACGPCIGPGTRGAAGIGLDGVIAAPALPTTLATAFSPKRAPLIMPLNHPGSTFHSPSTPDLTAILMPAPMSQKNVFTFDQDRKSVG